MVKKINNLPRFRHKTHTISTFMTARKHVPVYHGRHGRTQTWKFVPTKDISFACGRQNEKSSGEMQVAMEAGRG